MKVSIKVMKKIENTSKNNETVKNELSVTKPTKVVKSNSKKINTNVNFEKLYTELIECKTKCELVNTMLKYNLYTSTKPTTTQNINDLYIQFNEKSRLLISKKSLKVYTNNEHSIKINKLHNDFIFDNCVDGSYRTKRATVPKTIENFINIMNYFNSINAFTVIQK